MRRHKGNDADEIDELANPAPRRKRKKRATRADKKLDALAAAYIRAIRRLEDAARAYGNKPATDDIDASREVRRCAIAFASAHYAFTNTNARARKQGGR